MLSGVRSCRARVKAVEAYFDKLSTSCATDVKVAMSFDFVLAFRARALLRMTYSCSFFEENTLLFLEDHFRTTLRL